MNVRTYVIGPITHAITQTGAFDPTIRSLIELAIDALRPLGEVYSAHLTERFGVLSPPSSSYIFERDAAWVFQADVIVALLPIVGDKPLRTDGTYIEIGLSLANETPLVIAWSSHKAERYSHLIRGLHHRPGILFLEIDEIEANPDLLVEAVVDLYTRRIGPSSQVVALSGSPTEAHRSPVLLKFDERR